MSNVIRRFFKKYGLKILFWLLVIVVIALATINISLAFVFDGKFANAFTAISGWVSFLATILVGYIAYKQNREYKLENDRFEKRQEDRDWCQDKYAVLSLYRERINKCLDLFLEIEPLKSIDKLMDEVLGEKVVVQDIIAMKRLDIHRSNLFLSLAMTEYYVNGASELGDSFMEFLKAMKEALSEMKKISDSENTEEGFADNAGKILNEMQNKHASVVRWFKLYLSNLDVFLSTIVLSRNKEQLERDLKERKQQQDTWVESITTKTKKKNNEMKDNS